MSDFTLVYVASRGQYGTVQYSVPGNGTYRWYYVELEEGGGDLFPDCDLDVA